MLFKNFENYVQTHNHKMEIQLNLETLFSYRNNYFRCPISLELMRDPVVVATGQVFKIYEKCFIHKQYLTNLLKSLLFLTVLWTRLHSEMDRCRTWHMSKDRRETLKHNFNSQYCPHQAYSQMVWSQWRWSTTASFQAKQAIFVTIKMSLILAAWIVLALL